MRLISLDRACHILAAVPDSVQGYLNDAILLIGGGSQLPAYNEIGVYYMHEDGMYRG